MCLVFHRDLKLILLVLLLETLSKLGLLKE